MLIGDFGKLPERMKTPAVRAYYDMLLEQRRALFFKRLFDITASLALLLLLFPAMLVIAILIKLDSKGPVFYTQRRFTANLREFHIIKFRTMQRNADKAGPLVTVERDSRVTRVGKWLRPSRLDELPQLLNILKGDMSFVGTRPEVGKYISRYTDEMYATLLLPGGITSTASVLFRDEARLLRGAGDVDEVYVREILPQKMIHNLQYLREYSFAEDIKILIRTLIPQR